jgi:hypothetical protein
LARAPPFRQAGLGPMKSWQKTPQARQHAGAQESSVLVQKSLFLAGCETDAKIVTHATSAVKFSKSKLANRDGDKSRTNKAT